MKFCPKCGAQLPPNARFCVECGAKIPEKRQQPPSTGQVSGGNVTIGDVGVLRGNIDASTHVSTHIGSQTNISGDVNYHITHGLQEPTGQEIFGQALQALEVRNYAGALQWFEKYANKAPDDADGYYYLALTTFQGNRPKFAQLSTVRRAEGYLQTATRLDASCSHAYLLWALIKEDFYVANSMKVPEPFISTLISQVHFVQKRHAAEIITHIPARRNKYWEWLRKNL